MSTAVHETPETEEIGSKTSADVLGVPKVSAIKRKEDGLAALGLLSSSLYTLPEISEVVLNDQGTEQVNELSNAVQTVGTALATTGALTFAFQAAVTALGLKGDGLKPAAKTAIEETTEAAAKPAGKVLAEEGAETLAKSAGGLLSGLKVVGSFFKRVPVVGAIITGGFVAAEVGSFALQGEWNKAAAATAAGGAEIAGNIVGFGLGDAAREGTRAAFIAAGGQQFEDINKSDIRSLVEAGNDLREQFATAAADPQDTPVQTMAYTFQPQGLTHG